MGRYARSTAICVAGLALAAAVAAAAALAAGAAGPFAGVNFVSTCGFSHRAMDDPIVFPGQPGASHDHSFVGNTSTDAFSTLGSLHAAATTCQRPADRAAYWMPTSSSTGSRSIRSARPCTTAGTRSARCTRSRRA